MSKKQPLTLDDFQAWLEHLRMIEVPGDAILIQPRGQGFNPNKLTEISTRHRGSTHVLNHDTFNSPSDTSIDYMGDEPISDKANRLKDKYGVSKGNAGDPTGYNLAGLQPVEGYAAGQPWQFVEKTKTKKSSPMERLPVGYRFKTDKGMLMEVESYEDYDTYLCRVMSTGNIHALQGEWIKNRERVEHVDPEDGPRKDVKHYTTHGHEADHGPLTEKPQLVARCGGPGVCVKCSTEAKPF